MLQGGLSVRMGDEEFEAPAGSFTFQPRGIPHTFSSSSASARVLLLVVPSGLEGYLRSWNRPAEAMTLPPAGPPSPEQMAQVEAALAEHSVTFVHEGQRSLGLASGGPQTRPKLKSRTRPEIGPVVDS